MLGLSGEQKVSIPADTIPASFIVQGTHVQFEVVSASFGIRNYMLLPTSPLNPLDQTGGTVSPIFASKIPNLGVVLMGDVDLDLGNADIVIQRTGPGVTMKIQAKDCANGGLFQMEVERADGQKTLFTHVLADGVFYFDNPNFREREGDVVNFTPSDPTRAQQITITPRINWANDVSPTFVGRDSPQGGVPPNDTVRVPPPAGQCNNQIQKRDGGFVTVRHCGRVSQWLVASGGRMGMVTGEDATEVAPPASQCVKNCQAQNRVRGGAVVLGHPFPVPDPSRLKPPFHDGFVLP